MKAHAHPIPWCPRFLLIPLTILLTQIQITKSEGDSSSSEPSFYTVLNITRTGGQNSLYLLSLLLCTIGYTFLFYPFIFVPQYRNYVIDFVSQATSTRGKIVGSRRGRVFNPFRLLMPTKYFWYLILEYTPSSDPRRHDDNKILKEICIPEQGYERLQLRELSLDFLSVYTLPTHPYSGCLDVAFQCTELTPWNKFVFGVGGSSLVGVGLWISFVSNRDDLYDDVLLWKFWIVLVGHLVCIGLAYWGCNFVNRNRIEALLYDTSPGPVEHSICGDVEDVDGEDRGGRKRGGMGAEKRESEMVTLDDAGEKRGDPSTSYTAMV